MPTGYVFRMVLTINSDNFLSSINRLLLLRRRNVIPVRQELNLYVLHTRDSVFERLI
jgi:hypothetical protein